jgi:hypothetical protein
MTQAKGKTVCAYLTDVEVKVQLHSVLTSELHEGGGGFTLWPFYYGTSRPHDN